MKPSVIVWDLETRPDLGGFVAANDLFGASDCRTIAICECTALKKSGLANLDR